jgi:hypothetical protein
MSWRIGSFRKTAVGTGKLSGRSRRIAHGVEASPASARAQAFQFLLKFDYAQAAGK